MMVLFGAKEERLKLAAAYTQVTAIGMPFYIMGTGCSMYVRADGSPKYAMFSTIIGAVLNIIFDPIFIFVFDMGIRSAAIATVAGQVVIAIISVSYLYNSKAYNCKKNISPQTEKPFQVF